MKRAIAILFIFTLIFSGVTTDKAFAAAQCEETVLDKVWDWATTLGKEGLEKNQILAENKAERAKRCAEKVKQDLKKKMGL